MSIVYKVWIHVEAADEDADHYEDLGLPYLAGEFNNEDEAQALAAGLSGE